MSCIVAKQRKQDRSDVCKFGDVADVLQTILSIHDLNRRLLRNSVRNTEAIRLPIESMSIHRQ
jgi:hypothetical protein